MKTKHFLLPVAALVLVGSWIGIQRRALARLEEENGRLELPVVPAGKPGFTKELFPEMEKTRVGKKIKFGGLPEWKILAELVSGKSTGRPDARGLAEFDKLVKAMSQEELV